METFWWWIILICGCVFIIWSMIGLWIYYQLAYKKKLLICTRTSVGLDFKTKRAKEAKEGEFELIVPFPAFLAKSKNKIKPVGNKRIEIHWGRYEVTPILKIRDDHYEYIDFSGIMEHMPVGVVPSNVQMWNNMRKIESFKKRQAMKDLLEKFGPTIILLITSVALIVTAIYCTNIIAKVSDSASTTATNCMTTCINKALEMCQQNIPQQIPQTSISIPGK